MTRALLLALLLLGLAVAAIAQPYGGWDQIRSAPLPYMWLSLPGGVITKYKDPSWESETRRLAVGDSACGGSWCGKVVATSGSTVTWRITVRYEGPYWAADSARVRR